MDETRQIQQFLKDAYDSSRWCHERSEEQRAFDNAVTAELGRGKRIEAAVKKAVRQMPGMKVFLAGKTMPELAEYYERLHRLEQEIAIADNTRELVAIRNRNAQPMRSSEPPPFGALRATRQFGRAAHCSPFLPAAVAHLYRSSRCRLMVNALVLFVAAALGVKTLGAESSFYQRFQAAEHEGALKWDAHYAHGTPVPGEDMFIQDSSLVDTNNAGPVLTNGPVSYAGFTSRGELAGIKLGMNMSEVVAVWGKPKKLFYYCVPGPHFYYGTGMREELGLHFSGDRLVWIKINHLRAEHATFDNGLTGAMGRAETERLLGAPALRDIEYDLVREIDHDALPADLVGTNIQHWRYIGTYSYRAGKLRTDGVGKLRTDIRFDMTHGLSGSRERIQSIGVYLEWDVEPWQEPVWCF